MIYPQPIETAPRSKRLLVMRLVDTERHPLLPRVAWVKTARWKSDEHGVNAWREDAHGAPGHLDRYRLDPTHWAECDEIVAEEAA